MVTCQGMSNDWKVKDAISIQKKIVLDLDTGYEWQ